MLRVRTKKPTKSPEGDKQQEHRRVGDKGRDDDEENERKEKEGGGAATDPESRDPPLRGGEKVVNFGFIVPSKHHNFITIRG